MGSGRRPDHQEMIDSRLEFCAIFKKRRHVTLFFSVRRRVTILVLLFEALLMLLQHQASAFTCYRSAHRVNFELGSNPGLGDDIPSLDNGSSDSHQLEIEQRNLRFAGVGR